MNPKSHFRTTFAVAALLIGFGWTAPAHAAVPPLGLVNGSFEAGGAMPVFAAGTPGWGQWLGPAAAGSNYGIAQSSSGSDMAEDGQFYAFFRASQEITDCIGETLNTVPGQKYVVSFWLATDGPTNGQSDQMQVVWGPDFASSSSDQIFTLYQPQSPSALPYQKFTVTVTGVTTQDILAFHGFDATSTILLDNVTVTPLGGTPVPATTPWFTLLLAASLAALGVQATRWRRGASAA